MGTNRYAYAWNDPINGSDPIGHSEEASPRDRFAATAGAVAAPAAGIAVAGIVVGAVIADQAIDFADDQSFNQTGPISGLIFSKEGEDEPTATPGIGHNSGDTERGLRSRRAGTKRPERRSRRRAAANRWQEIWQKVGCTGSMRAVSSLNRPREAMLRSAKMVILWNCILRSQTLNGGLRDDKNRAPA
ncbi:MAG: hypothetical protein R3D33_00865 [Hyphomicrobiaceae bacterium]